MINSRRIKFIDEDFEDLILERKAIPSVMEGEGNSLIYKPKEDLTIIFQDIISEKPNSSSNHYSEQSEVIYSETLADIYIEQGNYEQAIKIYESLIKEKPDKARELNKKLNLLKKYLNQS
ncbi:MAG: tetratricopeptide repeat protein [Ignavibacteriales bacterium]|nr:tetratricopeptide repeat protein [Ignavibacteriales bacterium]